MTPSSHDHVPDDERHWDCRACWAEYRRERRAAGLDLVVRYGDKTTTQASLSRMLARKAAG